jgi:hypothetical protein
VFVVGGFGYASLMMFAAAVFLLAFFIMSFVKRGEILS